MSIALVVAAASNNVIGIAGKLPWNLPSDLAHFKKLTTGHPIIMGRKTYESIGRPLPNRINIVISRDKQFKADGCEVVGSLDQAIQTAGTTQESFIIGGGAIYEQALPMADKIYLTNVMAKPKGDTYFYFNHQKGWKLTSSEKHAADKENQYSFEFQVWQRT